MLRRKTPIFVWGIVYMLFAFMSYNEALNSTKEIQDAFLIFAQSLSSPQKLFFDVSIFFTIYLFILKKPFTEPMFVSRCKEKYLQYIIFFGVKICIGYLLYTIMLYLGIPIILGAKLSVNTALVLVIIRLFSVIFTLYLIYIIMLIKSNNQTLSIVSGCVLNIVLLLLLAVSYIFNYNLGKSLESAILIFYPWVSAIMVSVIFYEYKHKEFLL